MSANQIPAPGAATWYGQSPGHSCPNCWRHGGPGHTPKPEREDVPSWAKSAATGRAVKFANTPPIEPKRRTCSYWSARERVHCGETDKVRLHPGIGHRCETHNPITLNATYRALMAQTDTEPTT